MYKISVTQMAMECAISAFPSSMYTQGGDTTAHKSRYADHEPEMEMDTLLGGTMIDGPRRSSDQ